MITDFKPRTYAIIYATLIPLFAFIFLSLPAGSFKGDLSMNSFLTCLYFSTVTITTLGYGDISAVSSLAQILVILETIIGVVTIGLFLNSLSQQQSRKISEQEKQKQNAQKFRQECEKLLRHSKVIEQNIHFYQLYVYEVTTPISKRSTTTGLNPNFTFNNMKDLYKQSMRLTDNFQDPAVQHYYKHQIIFEQSIKELVLGIKFYNWRDLEDKCMEFLANCKTYDFSSSILSGANMELGTEKFSAYAARLIETHDGEVEFRNSNMINQFVALYTLIKLNLKFIEFYLNKVQEIRATCA